MNTWNEAIPFFSKDELACKGTGIVKLNREFAAMLPALRRAWGKPLTPNSVCRTPEYNRQINNGEGGHPHSLHLTENPKHPIEGTAAADIRWRGWKEEDQLKFARLAYSLGFAVGLHDGFCHVDWRQGAGLPQLCFLYGTWTGGFSTKDVIVCTD